MLRPAAAEMSDWGIDGGLLALETIADGDPDEAIVEGANHYDAVVIGESEPSVQDILFGTVPETIVQTTHRPVVIVRNPNDELEAAEWSTAGRDVVPPSDVIPRCTPQACLGLWSASGRIGRTRSFRTPQRPHSSAPRPEP